MYRRRRLVAGFPALPHLVGYRFLFGKSNRTADSNDNNNDNNKNKKGGASGVGEGLGGLFGGNSGSGLPPGFDMQKLRAMQEMISSQPPEKQMEMMNKALEFQKTIGKIPGIGRLAQKNIGIMEQVIKNVQSQQQETPPKGTAAGQMKGSSSGELKGSISSFQMPGASAGRTPGPTIDDLKKINLGAEIEELFAELSAMRAKKNSYRSKLLAKEEELEKLQKEFAQMHETDLNLRAKLRKVEHDVMLLNSENMEFKEQVKEWRKVREKNEELTSTVHRLQHSEAAQDRQRSEVLQAKLKEKEDALRSVQRKLERIRRRDPLLQFSRLCSDVTRFCNPERDPAKEMFDDTFTLLQSVYEEQQDRAWKTAMLQDGAVPRAYAAAVRRFFLSCVPHTNYDVAVAVEGDVEVLRDVVGEMGYTLHHVVDERYVIVAPLTGAVPPAFLGPYGLCVGLYLARKTLQGGQMFPFKLTVVSPYVSTTLFGNVDRVEVHYDTARSSGPGGQAANVTETQITAKLFIDGETAYVAEAQDSRSALSNREAATEKLGKARRQHYNEQLARQQRVEGVEQQLLNLIKERRSSEVDGGSDAGAGLAQKKMVDVARSAVEKGSLPRVEFALVCAMHHLSGETTAAAF